MKKDWDRRHAYAELDFSTIATLLEPVIPAAQVIAAEVLSGGLANTNYKVVVAGRTDPLVLRLYTRDRTACQKEYAIYSLIHDHVPIPEMLYVDDSATRHDFAYAVTQWVEGSQLETLLEKGSTADIAEVAYDTGKVLAAIGAYIFEQAGFFGADLAIAQSMGDAVEGHLAYIKQCLFERLAGQRLGESLTQKLWAFVQANAQYLDVIKDARSLVHADFNGSNILVRREAKGWRVAAVLDWEFAYASTPLADIGNMLRYDHQYDPVFEPNFVRGFVDAGGTLPEHWKKTVRLLDLLNLCEFLTLPDANDVLVSEVAGLIHATMAE